MAVAGGMLILTNRVDRLRKLVTQIREGDPPLVSERYSTTSAVDTAASLRKTFAGKPAFFTAAPDGKVIARASKALQEEVATTIATMK